MRWSEAYPLSDTTAQSVAHALLPESIDDLVDLWLTLSPLTWDGSLNTELFRQLPRLLGIKKYPSSPYYSQSNGIIENLHRPLKCALKTRRTEKWAPVLPTILLGFRAALKTDFKVSPAELVLESALRLPKDFFDEKSIITRPEELIQ